MKTILKSYSSMDTSIRYLSIWTTYFQLQILPILFIMSYLSFL